MYKVYCKGEYPKPKKLLFPENFETRRSARNFCYKRSWIEGLVIVHPDSTEEVFNPKRGEK